MMSPTFELQTLDALDRLSGQDTPLHRVDARAKIIAALAFSLAVISLPKYEVAAQAPFLILVILAAGLGSISPLIILRRSLVALPLALMLGAFNPILDRSPLSFGGWTLAAGWLSLASVALKALLSASVAVLLVASTSFNGLCSGLARLGVPRLFTQQLLFLWRYLGVLAEEVQRLRRARDLRDPRGMARGWRSAARLIGVLLNRALDRAERIHQAMLCRLYSGEAPAGREAAFSGADALFLALALAATAACRFLPLSAGLGAWLLKGA